MKVKQIMVMGAGAVGGYFGARIAEGTTADVSFIARGRHLKALQEKGLLLKSQGSESVIKVQACRNPEEAPSPDLVLFTVKSYDTSKAIQQVRSVVTTNTQILTLQNGIENYPKLVKAFGSGQVIQGFCKIGAGVPEPGTVAHKAFGEVTIGEQNGVTTDRLTAVEGLFKEAGVPVSISEDITRKVWLKFTWNCLLNMITAAGDVTVEKIFDYSASERLCYQLFEEIKEVAAAEGVVLKPEDGTKIIESAKELTGFETSTYQDRQKGKRMEYEAFTGAIVRLAEKHNLQIPYNETLYAILKLVDKSEK